MNHFASNQLKLNAHAYAGCTPTSTQSARKTHTLISKTLTSSLRDFPEAQSRLVPWPIFRGFRSSMNNGETDWMKS